MSLLARNASNSMFPNSIWKNFALEEFCPGRIECFPKSCVIMPGAFWHHPNPLTEITMKTPLRLTALAGTFGLLLTATSCVSPYAGPNQNNGAVTGAVGGGILGAVIGNQSGRALEGAAIGGLIGSFAGSSLGANQDQRFYGNQPAFFAPRPRPMIFGGHQRPIAFRRHVMVPRHHYGAWGHGGHCW